MKNFHLYKQGKYIIKIFNQLNNNSHFANIFIHKTFLQSYKKSYRINLGEVTITIPKANCWQTKNQDYYLCSVGVQRNYWIRDNLKIFKEKIKGWLFLLRYRYIEDFSIEQALNCSIEKERLEYQEFLKKSYAERLSIIQQQKDKATTKKRNFFLRKRELKETLTQDNINQSPFPPDLDKSEYELYDTWQTSLAYNNLSFEEFKAGLQKLDDQESQELMQELIDM